MAGPQVLVEVVAKYGSTVLDVRHIGRRLMQYTIGEGPRATLTTDASGLPDSEAFRLVSVADGQAQLRVTASMRGWVEVEGRRHSLSDAAEVDGSETAALVLRPGTRCMLVHDKLTFDVRVVDPEEPRISRSRLDRPFWFYNVASLIVFGTLLMLTYFVPRPSMELAYEVESVEPRFAGYYQHREPELAEEALPGHDSGQRHRGDEGVVGRPDIRQRSGLYSMRGPRDLPPVLPRRFDRVDPRQSGILGLIPTASGHFLASPDGAAFAVEPHDEDVWGGLHGNEVGAAFGAGGLGLVGTGRGGGGEGEGSIGLGNVGLIGRGGAGLASGRGRGSSAGFAGRGGRVPRVRQARAKPCGCWIPDDMIRRIIRAHINEVRHCYNQALVKNPNARGRVEIMFTIGPTGKVTAATVAESTLGDPTAERCIAKAAKRWRFPKSHHAGTAKVTYPFVLSPG